MFGGRNDDKARRDKKDILALSLTYGNTHISLTAFYLSFKTEYSILIIFGS